TQPLFAAAGVEGIFQQVRQGMKTYSATKIDADGAKTSGGKPLASRQCFIRFIQVRADFTNLIFCPRILAVKAIMANLQLGISGAIKLIQREIKGRNTKG